MLKFTRPLLAFICLILAATLPINHLISSSESTTTELHETQSLDPITISIAGEDNTLLPGHPFWVAIQVKLDPNWHAYWINPGDAGMAPMITWNLPDGFTPGTVLWPTPKRFELSSIVGFGYEDSFTLLAEILPPKNHANGTIDIAAEVRWLACSDSACQPGESTLNLKVEVSDKTPVANPANQAMFHEARTLLPTKNPTITAQRRNALIEVSFSESSFIKNADFYPEDKGSIDYTSKPLFETQPNKEYQHTIVLKEDNPASTLKGILVLNTADGTRAYNIDAPINDNSPNDPIVMSSVHPQILNPELFTHSSPDQVHSSFEFEGGVLLAIILAFIGGLLLNLMPCVLPVISLKVMSFIKLAGQSRKLILKHGLAFTAGVLLSFWVLAALLLTLQAYGRSVGWGFQLQEPIFVASLAALIFAFSLSLFGVFEMGTSLISAAGNAHHGSKDRNALVGSFLSGILATAVATPCTGPFLGSAVGFAVTLPPIQAMLIFTSLGLGMSFPYLLFAAFPALLRFMPKPGAWMITFKEIMGFFMLATVVWLLWVFGAQTSSLAVSALLSAFFLLAIACWIYGKWGTPLKHRTTRLIAISIALVFGTVSGYVLVWASTSLEPETSYLTTSSSASSDIADVWEEFSPERVAELREKGIPVFIDFTSKWCLICQANHMVLSLDEVSKEFASKGVVKMKADWTKRDAVITEELRKFGRNSVPLYVLYGNDKAAPQVLPQVLTPDVVVTSLNQIKSNESIAEN